MSDEVCILHKNKPNPRGYVPISYKGKTVGAHIVAYIEAYGSVPEGKQVNHTCDTTNCINSKHLYAGTQKDNMHDKLSRGRHRGTMTNDEKAYIGILIEKNYSITEIARMTGYHRSSIYRYIKKGR